MELLSSVWNRALDLIKQPTIHKNMLWTLLPLLITLFLMQLYFGRYKREELGWNSALGNSVILLFVGANLMSYLSKSELFYFSAKSDISLVKTIIASIVILESLILIITNFFHIIPKKIAFNVSSVLVLNFIAVISVILIYSDISVNYITLLAAFGIFIILSLFFKSIQIIIPEQVKKEFKEIKEALKKGKVELKEVEVEKKEQEKLELKKAQEEIKKEQEKIKRIKEEMKKDGNKKAE